MVTRAVVVAIGINAHGYKEVLGIAVGDREAEGFLRQCDRVVECMASVSVWPNAKISGRGAHREPRTV